MNAPEHRPTDEHPPSRCGVPWCRSNAYPGSQWCQFHEVVNPFDDGEPDRDDSPLKDSAEEAELW